MQKEKPKKYVIGVSYSRAQESRRRFVAQVAETLARQFSRDEILFDEFHTEEFAVVDLHIKLPDLYAHQSEIILVFICSDHADGDYTKAEWRAALHTVFFDDSDRVLLLKWDDTSLPGLFSPGAPIDLQSKTVTEVAEIAIKRLERVRARKRVAHEQLAADAQKSDETATHINVVEVSTNSAKEQLLSRQNDDLRSELQSIADALGQSRVEGLDKALRQLNQNKAADLEQALVQWLDSSGKSASPATRLRANLLLAESMLFGDELGHSVDLQAVRSVLNAARQLADASTSEDDCSRLLCVEARIEYADGRHIEALTLLDGNSDARCVRLKIAFHFQLEQTKEALQIVRDSERSCRWADVGCHVLASNGHVDESRELCNWAGTQNEPIAHRRCILALSRGLYAFAFSNHDGNEPTTVLDLADEECDQLRRVLRTLEPLLVNGRESGKATNGIEVQAFEIAIRVAHVLTDSELESTSARVLANANPISIQTGYAMLWRSLAYSDATVQRLRSEWPESFAAHYTAAAAQGSMANSGEDTLPHLPRLWELAKTDDEIEATASVVAQLAQRLGETAGNTLLTELEEQLGAEHHEYRLARAWFFIRSGRFDEVEEILNSVTDLKTPQWRLVRAELLQHQKNQPGVLDELVATAETISHPSLLWRTAVQAWELEEWPIVVRFLEKLIRLRPDEIEPRHHLWNAYTKLGTDTGLESAAAQLEELSRLEPNNSQHRFNHALILTQLARFEPALTIIDGVCDHHAALRDADHELFRLSIGLKADLLMTLERPDEAFTFCESYRNQLRNDVDFLRRFIRIAYRANRDDAAADATRHLNELEKDIPEDRQTFQAVEFEQIVEHFRRQAELRKQLRFMVTNHQLPWSYLGSRDGRTVFHEWIYRTQNLNLVPSRENCGAFVTYATNGFRAVEDDSESTLQPILPPLEPSPVVLDYTAIISLWNIGLLEVAIEHFGEVFASGTILQEFGRELEKLSPIQQSQREAAVRAVSAIDGGKVEVTDASCEAAVTQYDEIDDTTTIGIGNVIDWLQLNGRLPASRVEELKGHDFQRTEDDPTLATAIESGAVGVSELGLLTLVEFDLLEVVQAVINLQIRSGDAQQLRNQVSAWNKLDELRSEYRTMIIELRDNEHCHFESWEIPQDPADDENSSSQLKKVFERALAGKELAVDKQLPFVVDDRVCQQTLLADRDLPDTKAFSTWEIAESLYTAAKIDIARFAEVTVQFIERRYRFFVPHVDVLLHLAVEYRDSCPGVQLRLISQYAHDCMADPGLCCGPEPTTPVATMSGALSLRWYQHVAEFILALWHSDALTQTQKEQFTRWAIWELVPIPPCHADRQEQVNSAIHAHEVVMARILTNLTLDTSEFASGEMMMCVENAIGLSRAEFCRLADSCATVSGGSPPADVSGSDWAKMMALLRRRMVKHAVGYHVEHTDKEGKIELDHFAVGLLLTHGAFKEGSRPSWADIAETDLEAIQDRTSSLRADPIPGPMALIRQSNPRELTVVNPVELITYTEVNFRRTACSFLKDLCTQERVLSSRTQVLFERTREAICSEDDQAWYRAALDLTERLDNDFVFKLAGFRQSLCLPSENFRTTQSEYWTAVLSPKVSPREFFEFEAFFAAANEKMLQLEFEKCLNRSSCEKTIGAYLQRFRHTPLSRPFSLASVIEAGRWQTECFPELTQRAEESNPLVAYQCCQALLDLWEHWNATQQAQAIELVGRILSLMLRPQDHGMDGQMWHVQCLLARHYMSWCELHQPMWKSDATAALGWYLSDIVCDVIREDAAQDKNTAEHLERLAKEIIPDIMQGSTLLSLVLQRQKSVGIYPFATEDSACGSPFAYCLAASLPQGVLLNEEHGDSLPSSILLRLMSVCMLRLSLPDASGLVMNGFKARMADRAEQWAKSLSPEAENFLEQRRVIAAEFSAPETLKPQLLSVLASDNKDYRAEVMDLFRSRALTGDISSEGLWELITDSDFQSHGIRKLSPGEIEAFLFAILDVQSYEDCEWKWELPRVLTAIGQTSDLNDEQQTAVAATLLTASLTLNSFASIREALKHGCNQGFSLRLSALLSYVITKQVSLPRWAKARLRGLRCTRN